ncbi:succinate dehydrogenase cytochrome b558 subunit [soil metagenome]
MSELAAENTSTRSFFQRNYLLFRRLHSLSGILPIGVFLIAHLTTNSSLAWGGAALRGEFADAHWTMSQGGIAYFQKEVTYINISVPHLLLIEVTLWASIAFHSILGVFYAMTGRSEARHYGYWASWRYTLQRFSGYVGILFIFYHVATLRWGWTWLVPPFDGTVPWDHHFAASTLALALRGGEAFTGWGVAVSIFYFVAVSLLIFHFANGLWTAAITWGLTISARSQRQWGYACFAIGTALMFMGWSAIGGALFVDPAEARRIEGAVKAQSGPDKPGTGTGPGTSISTRIGE